MNRITPFVGAPITADHLRRLPESLRKKVAGFALLKLGKIVSHASKTWEKESINCLECCEKRFMEE